MQTATCRVKTNDSTITRLRNVTPAQAVLLDHIHKNRASGEVILETVLTGTISGDNEVKRLSRIYGGAKVEKLWPGVIKRLPQTFEEAGFPVVAQSTVVVKPAPEDVAEEVPVVEAPVPIPEPAVDVTITEVEPPAKKPAKVSKSKLA